MSEKQKKENMATLLEKKRNLAEKLDNIKSQLEWRYTDEYSEYLMEIINPDQVRITRPSVFNTVIVMPTDIFEVMCKFFLKLKGEVEEEDF